VKYYSEKRYEKICGEKVLVVILLCFSLKNAAEKIAKWFVLKYFSKSKQI